MNPLTFAVIGGDMRQAKLASLLAADGHAVSVFALEQAQPERAMIADSLNAAGKGADCVVLPLPLLRDGTALHTPLSDMVLTLDAVFTALKPHQILCGGRIPEIAQKQAVERGLLLVDYFNREELVIANAVATAEGAIQVAMQSTSTILLGTRVLILGFGRIGKVLAHRLRALGVSVTVSGWSLEDLAWIQAYGYKGIRSDRLDGALGGYDILFNTIPHLMLNAERLRTIDRDTLCIDLSSQPGGIDFAAAADLGLKTIHALGLPGEAAPLTAAAIIRDTIYNILSEQGIPLC
ncbi:MAG: dipicolinate synthase subunit DpsA [Oscillospiraceae bacterium]|nr:dipicolinate synthase subunit DpsA [Oscillospiraceae bacterium]